MPSKIQTRDHWTVGQDSYPLDTRDVTLVIGGFFSVFILVACLSMIVDQYRMLSIKPNSFANAGGGPSHS